MTRYYPDRRANRSLSDVDRVLLHVTKTDTCWLWTGYTDKGYGRLSIQDRPGLHAHRVMYQELVGPIPEGMHLDHLCRVRNCVNPDHLEPVTPLENVRRSPLTHGSETHCPSGHPYDDENTIRYRGRRYCRACRDRRNAARKAAA